MAKAASSLGLDDKVRVSQMNMSSSEETGRRFSLVGGSVPSTGFSAQTHPPRDVHRHTGS